MDAINKKIYIELRCKACGNPLVYDAPPPPKMSDPFPVATIRVQPCRACSIAMANRMHSDANPGWANLGFLTYKGSNLDTEPDPRLAGSDGEP